MLVGKSAVSEGLCFQCLDLLEALFNSCDRILRDGIDTDSTGFVQTWVVNTQVLRRVVRDLPDRQHHRLLRGLITLIGVLTYAAKPT